MRVKIEVKRYLDEKIYFIKDKSIVYVAFSGIDFEFIVAKGYVGVLRII